MEKGIQAINGVKATYDIMAMLGKAIDMKASDLHISPGMPPICRINGRLVLMEEIILTAEDSERFLRAVLSDYQLNTLHSKGEVDASVTCSNSRVRLNAYRRMGTYSIAMRLVKPEIPDFEELGLPSVVLDLAKLTKGLVLVTGPTGTGKTTSLAAMIDWINSNRHAHIITLEEPIEYVHTNKKSIINQREIGTDSLSFSSALRAALRQDPDVILIGEMRDLESISIALTAAETGHLVLSTLHTVGAAKTIDRIIDVFPPHQQFQIRTQLSLVLQGVISQQLVPTIDGKSRVAAVEVLLATPAVRNLIRENKTHQITNAIQTGAKAGMKTMDNSLLELYRDNRISFDDMISYAVDPDYLKKVVLG